MTNQKPPRGGLRNPPGGRPPMEKGERKHKLSITLDPNTVGWLKTQRQRPNEPMSQVVERLLQHLKGA